MDMDLEHKLTEQRRQRNQDQAIKVSVLKYSEADKAANNGGSEAQRKLGGVLDSLKEGSPSGRNIRYGMPFQVRGFLAEVDLTKVQVLVSSNRNHPDPGRARLADAKQQLAMVTTEDWAEHNQTLLAVNANFFALQQGTDLYQMGSTNTDGLSLSEGRWDQPPVINNDTKKNPKGWVALLFDRENRASLIENFAPNDEFPVSRDQSAIKVPQFYNGVAGTWLIKKGELHNELQPEPESRHARLAIGFPTDEMRSQKLYIVMFELQTALPRSSEYPVGKLEATEALLRALRSPDHLDFRKYLDDETLERGTRRRTSDELRPIIDLINEKKNYDEHDLRLDRCFICSTVTEDWEKPDEAATRAVISFADRMTAVKDAWKIDEVAGPPDDYVVRLRRDGQLHIFRKSRRPPKRTRGEDISVGLTLYEVAYFMNALGVRNAVNLDGSGSAAFVYTPPNDPVGDIKNAYHDGRPASDDSVRNRGFILDDEMLRPQLHAEDDDSTVYFSREMYHLEQYLRPRPAANHIGFKLRVAGGQNTSTDAARLAAQQ